MDLLASTHPPQYASPNRNICKSDDLGKNKLWLGDLLRNLSTELQDGEFCWCHRELAHLLSSKCYSRGRPPPSLS